jgi:vacuolar-type H+-ATPase subunit H
MDLIKKIKQAETQTQEIINRAKEQAVKRAEEGRLIHLEGLSKAETERKKAIEEAVSAAQSEAKVKIEQLKAQAETDRQQLGQTAQGKIDMAVARVLDYLKG